MGRANPRKFTVPELAEKFDIAVSTAHRIISEEDAASPGESGEALIEFGQRFAELRAQAEQLGYAIALVPLIERRRRH